MKILVLGSGGREHALVQAMAKQHEVHAAPGNPGMQEAKLHDIPLSDFQRIRKLCEDEQFELVVVGPDQALADGIVDVLHGFHVVGPSKEGARLESSKIYSKEFMTSVGIPTARYQVVKSVEDVEQAMLEFNAPWVFKVDGLALGKGVYICTTAEELGAAAKEVFVDKKFGPSGASALIEEFKIGWEASVHVLTNGVEYQIFPFAQDHKRLLEDNRGPNTGGMGTIAPIPIERELSKKIEDKVVRPSVAEIHKRGLQFRGVLFIGLMIVDGEPYVLEYNVRFGDPEAQVFMPLLDGDWGETLLKLSRGEMPALSWKPKTAAACVVLAAEGYPDTPVKNVPIHATWEPDQTSYVLHSGTKRVNSEYLVNGGRVLCAIGMGEDLNQAVANAYDRVGKIKWPGMQYRRDIGRQFTSSN